MIHKYDSEKRVILISFAVGTWILSNPFLIQIQGPSSGNGGLIGGNGDLYFSSNSRQHWQQFNPPPLVATAAASSGFPQQNLSTPPQNWTYNFNNGFHPLMRPS